MLQLVSRQYYKVRLPDQGNLAEDHFLQVCRGQ